MVQVFKIVRGKDNVSRSTWFDLIGPAPARLTRLTQDPLNIKKQIPRLEVRKKFFSNRVVDTWNALPSDVKLSQTVKIFKKHIERLIKNPL